MNQKGFTLVEVLIAVTIMSFLVLGVYTIVDDNYTTQTNVKKEDREYLQVQMALERVQQDLEQIYSPLYYSSYSTESNKKTPRGGGLNQGGYDQKINNFPTTKYFPKEQVSHLPVPIVEQESPNELVLFTAANRRRIEDQKHSRYIWVRYYVESDSDEADETSKRPRGLSVLKRKVIADDLYRDDIDWDKGPSQRLIRGVKSFAFEFWNKKTEKWVQRLRELESEERETPRLFRILLVVVDNSGQEHSHMRVIKPHWPYFDAPKEQKMIDLSKKKNNNKNNPGSNNSGPNTNPTVEEDGSEFDDEGA